MHVGTYDRSDVRFRRPTKSIEYDPADYIPLCKGVRFAQAEENSRPAWLIIAGAYRTQRRRTFLRKNLRGRFHYTSTCRMGARRTGQGRAS